MHHAMTAKDVHRSARIMTANSTHRRWATEQALIEGS
jgi:hypothetical protein